ncbi:MAG TPA: hypothetical protein VHO94_02720 [Oscillospiraceae bacterium]|nr:hypothetical protein [Oscillospiraceae bacterium]
MKKWFSILLCLMLTVIYAVPASANSGPSRFENPPAYGIAPVKDCPITVESENLTFQGMNQRENYSEITAKVTAAYRMKNPTANAMNVQMTFPIICDFKQLSANGGIKISAGGKDLPFTISLTSPAPNFSVDNHLYDKSGKLNTSFLPDFKTMLKNAVLIPNPTKHITDQNATYYQVKNVKGFLKVTMTAPQKKTGIISFSHQPTVRSGDQVTLGGYTEGGYLSTFSFVAIGEKPENIKISAYEDSFCKKELSTVPQLTVTQASPKELCMQCIANDYQIKEPLAQSIALGYMDNTLAQTGLCDMEAVGNIDKVNRIYLLNYTVPFAANSEQNVSVSYTTVPSMQEDKDFTTNTFAYLSNPAKNWASFQNLNVTVIPPSKDYTLTSSTIDLKADSSGNYKASLPTLPQNDIAFALHKKKPVTALASVASFSVPWWIPVAGIILILAIVTTLLYRKKHHKVNA